MTRLALVAPLLVAVGSAAPSPLPLPGGEGGIGFDDLQYSEELHRILAPAGRTGRLALVDTASRSVEVIEGFSRSDSAGRGHGAGTTSADAGAGFVFAIDRTDRTLVAVDPGTRRIVARAKLASGPDYVRWVEPAQEVWVTEPALESIETFRFQSGPSPTLTKIGKIPVPNGPESLVVDAAHGRAYTNTFRDATVAIDLSHHTVTATWPNGCRRARGIALDASRQLVLVGCDEGKAVALDASQGGRIVGTAQTGPGVDGIAYSPRLSHLYVPAAATATLSVIAVGEHGQLEPLGTLATAPGAHCAAADDLSNVLVCDPGNGRLLVARDPYVPPK